MAGRGRRGRGGGGARAAPLKRAAAGAGAAEPWSGPVAGRACVCLCFARARSSASRRGAAKVCGVFSSSPRPRPCRLHEPLPSPLPTEGLSPGTARAAPFSLLRPRAGRWNVGTSADGPLSLPEKRKDGKKRGEQLGGCSQRVEPSRNGHFGVLCGLFSHGRCALHPLPSKERRVGASRNINLPTGREAPSLPGRQKTRTSTFITSLLPLLPS